jgi:uncharacterized circularly permuted ATP-grasp superfamily protein/uncharacterized alpha-E superfamily protein
MPNAKKKITARSLTAAIIRETEYGDGSTTPRPFVAPLVDQLRKTGIRELRDRQSRIESLSQELDIHFSPDRQQTLDEFNWQLDPLPRVIDPAEWKEVEAGLIQRARAFNLLLADIYSKQKIIQDGVIPCELIFDDPAFLLSCHNVKQPENRYITLGAVDLARSREGRWQVTANHYSLPYGLSFVLQNRRMLSQSFPEIFEPIAIHPVTGFSSELAEALASLAPNSNPLIVMLTRAGQQNNQFEETFLARRMGVPLVEPGDLLVRNNRVYLKTVGGLERVDIIYRRTSSQGLDPIAFQSRRGSGVPGLLNCVRKGQVAVVNAFGAGVADNKALLPYSDRIIRYYLKEAPLLPTATTYWCQDPDQLDYVRSHLSKMLLKPIHRQQDLGMTFTAGQKANYLKEMKFLMEHQPELVVAQPYIDASQCPLLDAGSIVSRPAYLRAFCLLGGSRDRVLPGGLTRQALSLNSHHYIADLAGGAKDTWIPVNGGKIATTTPSRKALIQARKRVENRSFRATSRVGEQLYWMGRYIERSEHTARMVRVLTEQGWEALPARERKNMWPLWQAAAASTGHPLLMKMTALPKEVLPIARDLVLNEKAPASVLSCAHAALRNGAEIREFLTPEVWSSLSRFVNSLESIPHKIRISATRLQDTCTATSDEVARTNGTISRTMPHDDGWECYRIGVLLERAISTTVVLGIVVPEAILSYAEDNDHDPDLTSLLRMLGSLDAYQREYRSRTYLRQTADLLWKSEDTPSSLGYCVRQLIRHLEELEQGARSSSRKSPLKHMCKLQQKIQSIQTEPLFPHRNIDSDLLEATTVAKARSMAKKSKLLSQQFRASLNQAHELLEDKFFSHLTSSTK